MKRFYGQARVEGSRILLDERPVRTPARALLELPSRALAEAISDEWNAQDDEIRPRSMPLTGLANAAIDRVTPDPQPFAADLARYAATDLLCYRAEGPASLTREQAELWDPPLEWARTCYNVHFLVTAGVLPVEQPPETLARLGEALELRTPFELAGLQPLVTIGGSLVVALAILEEAIAAETGFDATQLDELWQARQWGEDSLSAAARENRRVDFLAAARFLALL